MTNNLSRRLDALENQSAADKGFISVTACPGGYYGRPAGEPFDYGSVIPNEDGSMPAGAAFYTAAEVEVMRREGWHVTVLKYVSDWRSDGAEVAA
jgi:hypothetical protein